MGQYDEIGVVVMALRPDLTIDKPNNPHVLPPPLNPGLINGDILLMRVSPAEDEDEESLGDDNVEEENTKTGLSSAAHKAGQSNSQDSDDFFQDFTCEEYLDFVERSANEPLAVVVDQTGEEEEGSLEQVEDTYHHSDEGWQDFEDDDEDDEEDGNYVAFDEEEEKVGMMNLIMGQILRKFREEHGRGPDTKELLQMRQALAMKLGVDVPAVWDDDDNNREETSDQDDEDDEDKDKDLESKKRSADDALEKIEKRTAKKPKVRWSSEYQYKNIGLEPESFDEIEENEDESEQIQEIQQEA